MTKLRKGLGDLSLTIMVDIGRRLVEHQHLRVLDEGPGDGTSLVSADSHEPTTLNPLLAYGDDGSAKMFDGLLAYESDGIRNRAGVRARFTVMYPATDSLCRVGGLAARRLMFALPIPVLVSMGVFTLGAASLFDPLYQYYGSSLFSASAADIARVRAELGVDQLPWTLLLTATSLRAGDHPVPVTGAASTSASVLSP